MTDLPQWAAEKARELAALWNDPGQEAAIARALAEVAGPKWQAIETAPKDGTWVLGWSAKDASPYRVQWRENHNGRMSWCTAFASFVEDYITHWMPLPAAPEVG